MLLIPLALCGLLGFSLSPVYAGDKPCVDPGVCTPPTDYKYVVGRDATPREQWAISGGFCGALSIQTIAMTYGYWVSEDLIRKAAPDHGQGGHGNSVEGYEILHSNIEDAMDNLGLTYNSWDWKGEAHPQGEKYLGWMKSQLLNNFGVVQFVLCKGDAHSCYDGSPYDHIEPFYRLYTNHPLNDTTVYDDDIVAHTSDYAPDGVENTGYYRPMGSLLDDLEMQGNCKDAQAGWGYNEMYPCIYSDLTYGYAITGLVDKNSNTVPVNLAVDSISEPDIRRGEAAANFTAHLTVSELEEGSQYTIYRWDDYKTFPRDGDYASSDFAGKHDFSAESTTYKWNDATSFLSSGSVIYRCVPNNK